MHKHKSVRTLNKEYTRQINFRELVESCTDFTDLYRIGDSTVDGLDEEVLVDVVEHLLLNQNPKHSDAELIKAAIEKIKQAINNTPSIKLSEDDLSSHAKKIMRGIDRIIEKFLKAEKVK